ncbi:MAG: hypothetical protein U0074_08445 [Kouleothrix sp.]
MMVLFPWLVESARQIIMNRQIARHKPHSITAPRFERMSMCRNRRALPAVRGHCSKRQRLLDDAPLALQMLKTRTAEQSVEDLRRIIFMPLNAPDMELSAALDVGYPVWQAYG